MKDLLFLLLLTFCSQSSSFQAPIPNAADAPSFHNGNDALTTSSSTARNSLDEQRTLFLNQVAQEARRGNYGFFALGNQILFNPFCSDNNEPSVHESILPGGENEGLFLRWLEMERLISEAAALYEELFETRQSDCSSSLHLLEDSASSNTAAVECQSSRNEIDLDRLASLKLPENR